MAGRPRDFCIDTALDSALKLFWQKGFEATSLTDLTKAMGINRPSLYAAYGNKEELYRKALNRYITQKSWIIEDALSQPTSYDMVKRMMDNFIGTPNPSCTDPRGCMTTMATLACSIQAQSIQNDLAAYKAEVEKKFHARLNQAIAEGDLPKDADPASLLMFIFTVLNGLAMHSKMGTSHEQMKKVAAMALTAWPSQPKEAARQAAE